MADLGAGYRFQEKDLMPVAFPHLVFTLFANSFRLWALVSKMEE